MTHPTAIPPASSQRAECAHLDGFETISPWDDDPRLLAKETGTDTVTVGQYHDGDLDLVTLRLATLEQMVCGNSVGRLDGHPGWWAKRDEQVRALSEWTPAEQGCAPKGSWAGWSTVIEVKQTKFGTEHRAVLTVLDAAELLAAFAE